MRINDDHQNCPQRSYERSSQGSSHQPSHNHKSSPRLSARSPQPPIIVCVQTSNRGQRARALSAPLPLSLPTKAVHTMVFQGTSAPSIPPSIQPAAFPPSPYDSRKHPPRPRNSQQPPPMAISNGVCLLLSLYCLGQRTTM